MSFPFAGFGTFLFLPTEQPIWDTDTGWQPSANIARNPILGGTSDSVVLLSYGSNSRSFECYMAPDRLAALRGLLGTAADFCDWTRPTPDSRRAFLAAAPHLNNIAAINRLPGDPDNQTQRREHVRIELISQ